MVHYKMLSVKVIIVSKMTSHCAGIVQMRKESDAMMSVIITITNHHYHHQRQTEITATLVGKIANCKNDILAICYLSN